MVTAMERMGVFFAIFNSFFAHWLQKFFVIWLILFKNLFYHSSLDYKQKLYAYCTSVCRLDVSFYSQALIESK